MDFSTDILRTFVAAAETESYTAAANTVHRTQSAVSMQMKRLEEGIGNLLFARNGHSMKLTTEGHKLLWYARRILKLHDEALAAITTPEMKGKVRLGAPDDYAERLLSNVLTRFSVSHPQVQVDVTCEPSHRLLESFDSGNLDLVILTNGETGKRGDQIYREQVVWISSDKHLTHEQDPIPLAMYHDHCIFREWAIKKLDQAGKRYRIAYTSANTMGIFAAVKAGLAIAPVGLSTLPPGVRVLTPSDGFPELPLSAITLVKPNGKLAPAIESFAEHVAETFKEMASNLALAV